MKITVRKLLIANRGEIAVRIMRTAHDMGIATVAVYSDADKGALFVSKADEAICIGGNYAADSYLMQDKIIAAAKKTGADAIHPGYGFLSENASFSKRCKDEGIVFVGPSYEAITAMGSKIGAKVLMIKAGVPVVPGYHGADQTIETLKAESNRIGYPILLKASAGGGGKGMRIVNKEEELEEAVQGASREAEKSFGSGTLLIEKYFPSAKHIEFQIFGDEHGHYTHFFDRECSLQRRYQKVIEESPSPSLSPALRKEMGDAAVAAARSISYTNAGTVEFILDKNGAFYFLEVNTRLQVEHPVTEETTGLDLVRMQIEVAQGMPLSHTSETVTQKGHAIECRINAEDPENNFFPDTGEILFWQEQRGAIRYDSGVATGSEVNMFYDSMIAKVISHADTRKEAVQRMLRALDNTIILGVTTNRDFLKELLTHPAYIDGSFDTKLIEREFSNYKRRDNQTALDHTAIVVLLRGWCDRKQSEVFNHSLNGWRNIQYQPLQTELEWAGQKLQLQYTYNQDHRFDVNVEGKSYAVELIDIKDYEMTIVIDGHRQNFFVAKGSKEIFVQHPTAGNYRFREAPRFDEPDSALSKGGYISPMPGEIIKVMVKAGDKVKAGKGLLVMNSMKMETTVEAQADGQIEEVYVSDKMFVEANTVLLKMKEE